MCVIQAHAYEPRGEQTRPQWGRKLTDRFGAKIYG